MKRYFSIGGAHGTKRESRFASTEAKVAKKNEMVAISMLERQDETLFFPMETSIAVATHKEIIEECPACPPDSSSDFIDFLLFKTTDQSRHFYETFSCELYKDSL